MFPFPFSFLGTSISAAAPILTASNAAVDVVTLIYDGTNYLATSVLNLS